MAIRKKKNGKWEADFYLNGKRIKKQFPKKGDADKYITKRKANEHTQQITGMETRFSTLTFGKIATQYRDNHLIHTRAKANATYINNLISRWGEYTLSTISPPEVRMWFSSLFNSDYAISTVEKHLTYFKRVFNYAIEMEIININPITVISYKKEFKKKTHRNTSLSQDQFSKFVLHFENSQWYIKSVVLMLWHTGMRISEVLNLKWSDIRINEGVIVLDADRVKEGKIRTIGLENELVDILVSLKAINDRKGAKAKAHIFGITQDKPLTYQSFYRSYKKILKNTPFFDFNIHDQRHSYTIRKRQEGHDKEVIMIQQGHSSDSMWNWYNDVAVDEVLEMSGFNKDKSDIIENNVSKLIEQMSENDISIATLHTLIRKKTSI